MPNQPFPGLRTFVAAAAGGDDRAIDRAMDLRPARQADDAIQNALAITDPVQAGRVLDVAEEQLRCLWAAAEGMADALTAARKRLTPEPAPEPVSVPVPVPIDEDNDESGE